MMGLRRDQTNIILVFLILSLGVFLAMEYGPESLAITFMGVFTVFSLVAVWYLFNEGWKKDMQEKPTEIAGLNKLDEATMNDLERLAAIDRDLGRKKKLIGWFFFILIIAFPFLLFPISFIFNTFTYADIFFSSVYSALWGCYFYFYYKYKNLQSLVKDRIRSIISS